ncbi:MAG: MFS transporter [Thermoguttaceae bacterium]|nr:MFS transporter [Thermoguttaceae bacterium]
MGERNLTAAINSSSDEQTDELAQIETRSLKESLPPDARLVCWNSFLWGLGNTLVSTTLIIYIVFGLVDRSSFSWLFLTTAVIAASPRIVGVLRAFAPKALGGKRFMTQKAAGYLTLSGLTLSLIPFLVQLEGRLSVTVLISCLILLWSIHHLNQYIGTIAINCWIGGHTPDCVRGQFYAARNRYELAGAMLASGLAFYFKDYNFPIDRLLFWAWAGAAIIILSNIPLLFCSRDAGTFERQPEKQPEKKPSTLSTLFSPLCFKTFGMFLLYGIAFSFINGLTQTPQYEYSIRGLKISYEFYLFLLAISRLGQWTISWFIGRWLDNALRSTMMISQFVVAVALFFLGVANENFYYVPIYLSWICWTGYAGLNVGVPKHLHRLSYENGARAATFSLYYAVGGIAYSISLILSGAVLDFLSFSYNLENITFYGIPFFAVVLITGAFLRLLLVPLLGFAVGQKPKETPEDN